MADGKNWKAMSKVMIPVTWVAPAWHLGSSDGNTACLRQMACRKRRNGKEEKGWALWLGQDGNAGSHDHLGLVIL